VGENRTAPVVTEFNDDIHFTQTLMNWTGVDRHDAPGPTQSAEVNPLAQQLPRHGIQAYEQDLMENVVDYERFGIPTACRRTPRWV